jgi:hypothetical protein
VQSLPLPTGEHSKNMKSVTSCALRTARLLKRKAALLKDKEELRSLRQRACSEAVDRIQYIVVENEKSVLVDAEVQTDESHDNPVDVDDNDTVEIDIDHVEIDTVNNVDGDKITIEIDTDMMVEPVTETHIVDGVPVQRVVNWSQLVPQNLMELFGETCDVNLVIDFKEVPSDFFKGCDGRSILRFWLEWPEFCREPWKFIWFDEVGCPVPSSVWHLWQHAPIREPDPPIMLDFVMDVVSKPSQTDGCRIYNEEEMQEQMHASLARFAQLMESQNDMKFQQVQDAFASKEKEYQKKINILEQLLARVSAA